MKVSVAHPWERSCKYTGQKINDAQTGQAQHIWTIYIHLYMHGRAKRVCTRQLGECGTPQKRRMHAEAIDPLHMHGQCKQQRASRNKKKQHKNNNPSYR
jgi:hypothetical protein